ncbi:hypothetical protein [Rhodococcus sp. PvR099]|uniref:hypothetical protein n=1 Tax=Rhodococcus sp. PvR099 TaxID=2806602 RepID=UPI001AE5A948|nr:hypothetical protein [Rhodococcus sp. PvR099]MBP1159831.1 hypothetical protein [Rhodococcus sp. PvR099]
MTPRERPGEESPTEWLTAAFWILTLMFMYRLIGILYWWEYLVFTIAGVALSYMWWTRRRRGQYWLLFGVTCGLFGAGAIFGSGASMFSDISVPADSVGQTEIVCGSVVNPVPGSELKVTDAATGETVVRSSPLPQSELERVCSDRLEYRTRDAAGVALVGLLVAVRAAGHLLPLSNSVTTVASGRAA